MNMLKRSFAALLISSPLALAQNDPAAAPPAENKPAETKPDAIAALRGRPDAATEDLLGGTFQSPVAGIAFRVPGSCQQIAKSGEEIAHFANPEKTWEMIVSKSTSGQPMALGGDDKKVGLLEVVAARLKQTNPGIQIMRQDVVNLGETPAGMIAARFSIGTQRRLLQQAIVQANDQLYYTFALTTPAAKGDNPDAADPTEKVAVDAFRQMLDTVKLLDRSPIKDDQNERLVRTRALFTNLTEKKLRASIVPEQWLRLISDGKDIGYTYVVEEVGAVGPNDGIKVGIRSRSYPEKDAQVDGETWYFVSFDRAHETWRSLAWIQNLKDKSSDQFTEIGSSDRRVKRSVDRDVNAQPGDARDPKQPPVVTSEVYTLEVQTTGKAARNAIPLKQELSPWYLPQAAGHLLPRLVPVKEPKSYMFAVYVSDQAHVMHRYIDVGNEENVDLNGQQIRAIPISDRVGLEGSPTIHYMSPEGKYLGSVNRDSKITILPSDASSLQKIWANRADLTRPREIEQQPASGR